MRINIFDNGLQGRRGHHFDFSLNMAKGFAQKGFAVNVCGARDADIEMDGAFEAIGCTYTPLFSHFAYAPLQFGSDVIAELNALSHIIAGEMASLARADLNIFSTLKPLEFHAFSLLLQPSPMIGLTHAGPNFFHGYSAQFWNQATLNLVQQGAKVVLGANDPFLAAFVATFSNRLPVWNLPMPLNGTPKAQYRNDVSTIGFFGHQRSERGLALIPQLVDRLLEQGYEVVVHDTSSQLNARSGNPDLRVLNSFVSDLSAEIAKCDLIICPMQWESYVHRLSGVVCCALASGVPLVLPAGTLSALRFHPLGSSTCYFEHSVEGILHAVAGAVANYPAHVIGAQRGVNYWRERHGVERFVDFACGEISA